MDRRQQRHRRRLRFPLAAQHRLRRAAQARLGRRPRENPTRVRAIGALTPPIAPAQSHYLGWLATHACSCKIRVRITREICLKCPKILRARLPPRQHDHAPALDGKHLRRLRNGRRRGPGLDTIVRADNSAFNDRHSRAASSSWSMRTTAGSLSPVCRMCSLCCLPKALWVWWLCKDHRGLHSESFLQSESSGCVPQMVKNRSRCAAFR